MAATLRKQHATGRASDNHTCVSAKVIGGELPVGEGISPLYLTFSNSTFRRSQVFIWVTPPLPSTIAFAPRPAHSVWLLNYVKSGQTAHLSVAQRNCQHQPSHTVVITPGATAARQSERIGSSNNTNDAATRPVGSTTAEQGRKAAKQPQHGSYHTESAEGVATKLEGSTASERGRRGAELLQRRTYPRGGTTGVAIWVNEYGSNGVQSRIRRRSCHLGETEGVAARSERRTQPAYDHQTIIRSHSAALFTLHLAIVTGAPIWPTTEHGREADAGRQKPWHEVPQAMLVTHDFDGYLHVEMCQ